MEVSSAVPAPGSKSTVPEKYPVVYTLPDESTATEKLSTKFLWEKFLAHT